VTWPHHDNEPEYEPADEPEGRRWVGILVGALVLAMIGSGSAFAWRAYGGSPYPGFALGSSAVPESKPVGRDEFNAFKQQLAAQTQSNAQALAAQQAELKRVSDQLAAVSAKLDALQSSISSARASIPAAMPIPAKKPSHPKPVPHVSTAAPLAPPIQLTR
jgi:uncharacterized coiled-coil protein SlyX